MDHGESPTPTQPPKTVTYRVSTSGEFGGMLYLKDFKKKFGWHWEKEIELPYWEGPKGVMVRGDGDLAVEILVDGEVVRRREVSNLSSSSHLGVLFDAGLMPYEVWFGHYRGHRHGEFLIGEQIQDLEGPNHRRSYTRESYDGVLPTEPVEALIKLPPDGGFATITVVIRGTTFLLFDTTSDSPLEVSLMIP